ncbi:MAG: universal stress protein [Proteobacteria bacterium]|nr:universal stress protein [Pseudomonadota bacterium]
MRHASGHGLPPAAYETSYPGGQAQTWIKAERHVQVVTELMNDLTSRGHECLAEVRARAEALGVNLETMNTNGLAPEVITRVAKERGATLIVMSSHGQTGLRRLLMGGVTSKVIKLAPCPIYISRT